MVQDSDISDACAIGDNANRVLNVNEETLLRLLRYLRCKHRFPVRPLPESSCYVHWPGTAKQSLIGVYWTTPFLADMSLLEQMRLCETF